MIDPIQRFQEQYSAAQAAGIPLPDGMSLATVGADGRPSVRIVLLKGVSERGFSFYTNADSRKGRELAANPNAALCIWWPSLGQQTRVEGVVSRVSDAEADAYWATRPRGSQIGAWASQQSQPIGSRDELLARVAELEARYQGQPVPRPPYWTGFVLAPSVIEFWYHQDSRLHDRERYTRGDAGWLWERLQP